MSNKSKVIINPIRLSLNLRWTMAFVLIVASMLLGLQSCSKANDGGTTGGNPLSSLPETISVDAQ